MNKLVEILAVGLGGAVGSMLRYGVTLLFGALGWSGNIGTMTVNVAGSFIIGYLTSAAAHAGTSGSTMLLMLTVGLCGGFTTFSTFSMQSVRLLQAGQQGTALLYVAGTFFLCLFFCGLGWYLGAK